MPKFTITIEAGDGPEQFDEAIEFPDIKAATDDAQIALAEMVRDKLPNGKQADFGVKVEDADGKQVYQAEMHFTARNEDDIAEAEANTDAAARDVASSIRGGFRK